MQSFFGGLSFGGSLATKNIKLIFLNNPLCLARPTLIDLNTSKPCQYSFGVTLDRHGGSFNTFDDHYARLWVSNKTMIKILKK